MKFGAGFLSHFTSMISVATERVTQPSYCLSFLLCKGSVQNMSRVTIWLNASVTSTEEAWIIFIQCSMEMSVVFFNAGCCSRTRVFFVVAVLGPCSISSLCTCVCFTWLERPERHFQANSKNAHACHVQSHGLSPNQSASCTSWLGFLCFCLWISVHGDRFPVAVLLLTCPFLSSKNHRNVSRSF